MNHYIKVKYIIILPNIYHISCKGSDDYFYRKDYIIQEGHCFISNLLPIPVKH